MFCCLRTCLNGGMRNAGSTTRERLPEVHLDPAFIGPDVILLSKQLRLTGSGGALGTAPLVQSKSYFEIKIQQAGSWSVGLATKQTDLTKKIGGSDKDSWCLCSDNATRHNNEQCHHPVVQQQQQQQQLTESVPNGGELNNVLNKSINSTALAAGLIGIEDIPEDDFVSTQPTKNTPSPVHTSPLSGVHTENAFPGEGDIVGVSYDHIELNFYFNGKNLEVPFRNVKGTVYPAIYVGNGAIVDIILDNFHFGPPQGFDKIMLEQSLL